MKFGKDDVKDQAKHTGTDVTAKPVGGEHSELAKDPNQDAVDHGVDEQQKAQLAAKGIQEGGQVASFTGTERQGGGDKEKVQTQQKEQVEALRAKGMSYSMIADSMGMSVDEVRKATGHEKQGGAQSLQDLVDDENADPQVVRKAMAKAVIKGELSPAAAEAYLKLQGEGGASTGGQSAGKYDPNLATR